jgi:RNA polymerase-binding transcription factor DksA
VETYEETMAPMFSHILLQKEYEQHKILREATERFKTEARALAHSAADYAKFDLAVREIKALWSARRRIDDHSYGKCINCQDSIDLKRLNLYPAATNCLACEIRRERAAMRLARRYA